MTVDESSSKFQQALRGQFTNTQNIMTKEEEARAAKVAEACKSAASRGFITHLKTAGVADAKIEKLHATYVKGVEKYASKVEEMRTSILQGLGRTA